MGHDDKTDGLIDAFIEKWAGSGGGETANFQSFANELCDVLDVPHPEPTVQDDDKNTYVFEKAVRIDNGDGTVATKRADLFKQGCFVCEAKQGSDGTDQGEMFGSGGPQKKGTAVRGTGGWDKAMVRAKNQADRYARFLGWPPFLIVVDVGHVIELFADFSGTGQNGYTPFRDSRSHRIRMDDLRDAKIRKDLAAVFTDPHSIDPSKISAAITRDVAAKLAKLAKSFEGEGRAPETVAGFLMRCLFTMFAEDVKLLPKDSYTELLKSLRDNVEGFPSAMEGLWKAMDNGEKTHLIKGEIRKFNGKLFKERTALKVSADQLKLLIKAAEADWSEVEPAIFGTLLERALDPRERHKLGAHYTPRAYVERLVMPTIIEPLRAEWAGVQAAAMNLEGKGKHKDALDALQRFHRKLCDLRVLDPACGSGNFLYVALEHMKRLEGEVIDVLDDLDPEAAKLELEGHTISPEQFLGIEVNERAAIIAEVVLWIGFLQWHLKTTGRRSIPTPVLQFLNNIEHRDAVLDWDDRTLLRDEAGAPITHWDGRTTKPHPVTGEEVPDEAAQIETYEYANPRPAKWPEADYIVGNPPFIGASKMRHGLGDGYTEAIRAAIPKVPESADYVMYWWHHAALLLRDRKVARFGFITTNSLRQTFNRRVLEEHMKGKKPLALVFAIPDHPWVDAALGAAVRIAMTVAAPGPEEGVLQRVESERKVESEQTHREVVLTSEIGIVHSDLRVGIDFTKARQLKANDELAARGVTLGGQGFVVSPRLFAEISHSASGTEIDKVKPYMTGYDLNQKSKGNCVVDLFGMGEEEARRNCPTLYQHVYNTVRDARLQNRRPSYRENWWIFAEPRTELRKALAQLERYIGTARTAKHRVFQLIDGSTIPESEVICIASEDIYLLGVVSSKPHVSWALTIGGTLEDRPRYNNSICFDPYPFPDPPDALKAEIRELGEELDAHRKRQQAAHPDLTMTGMYNVLEALRADDGKGRALTDKEKAIHDQGLVSVLKDIHDRLDAAVIRAYGWPTDISEDEMLAQLVALNRERAEEEAQGKVRWLRPEYQNPDGQAEKVQTKADLGVVATPATAPAWPRGLPEQMRAVRDVLSGADEPMDAEAVARSFKRGQAKRVEELLTTLTAIGQARAVEGGRYAAR